MELIRKNDMVLAVATKADRDSNGYSHVSKGAAIRRHSERLGGPRPTGRMHIAAPNFRPYIKSYIMVLFRPVRQGDRPA
jgi:hypothetical protein